MQIEVPVDVTKTFDCNGNIVGATKRLSLTFSPSVGSTIPLDILSDLDNLSIVSYNYDERALEGDLDSYEATSEEQLLEVLEYYVIEGFKLQWPFVGDLSIQIHNLVKKCKE